MEMFGFFCCCFFKYHSNITSLRICFGVGIYGFQPILEGDKMAEKLVCLYHNVTIFKKESIAQKLQKGSLRHLAPLFFLLSKCFFIKVKDSGFITTVCERIDYQ